MRLFQIIRTLTERHFSLAGILNRAGVSGWLYQAAVALKLVLEGLKPQPVFLCIDGTIAVKFGKKFEDVSELFDHAAHNDCNFFKILERVW